MNEIDQSLFDPNGGGQQQKRQQLHQYQEQLQKQQHRSLRHLQKCQEEQQQQHEMMAYHQQQLDSQLEFANLQQDQQQLLAQQRDYQKAIQALDAEPNSSDGGLMRSYNQGHGEEDEEDEYVDEDMSDYEPFVNHVHSNDMDKEEEMQRLNGEPNSSDGNRNDNSLPQYLVDHMMYTSAYIDTQKRLRKRVKSYVIFALVAMGVAGIAITVRITRNRRTNATNFSDVATIGTAYGDNDRYGGQVLEIFSMAPANLNILCSTILIETELGFQKCQKACDAAQCCMSDGNDNCINSHEKECGSYAPCIVLTKYKINTPGNFADGSASSLSSVSDRNNNKIMIIPPPPSSLTKICSSEAVSKMDGFIICSDICSFSQCCTSHSNNNNAYSTNHYLSKIPDNCFQQNVENCNDYHNACKNLSESTAPLDDSKALQDESSSSHSAGVYTPPKIDVVFVCSDAYVIGNGYRDCNTVCGPRACCFTEGIENCHDLDPTWCDKYERCTVLDVYGGMHKVGPLQQVGETKKQDVVVVSKNDENTVLAKSGKNMESHMINITEEINSYPSDMSRKDNQSNAAADADDLFVELLTNKASAAITAFSLDNNTNSSTVSIQLLPNSNDIDKICSTVKLSTTNGMQICEEICEQALCCFAPPAQNCRRTNEVMCNAYGGCEGMFLIEMMSQGSSEQNQETIEQHLSLSPSLSHIEAQMNNDNSTKDNYSKNITANFIIGVTYQKPDPSYDCRGEVTLSPQSLSRCFIACEAYFCCFQNDYKQDCAMNHSKQCEEHGICRFMAAYDADHDRSEIVLPPDNLELLCSISDNENESSLLGSAKDIDDGVVACGEACEVAECCQNKKGAQTGEDLDCSAGFCLKFSSCVAHWEKQTPPLDEKSTFESTTPPKLSIPISTSSSSFEGLNNNNNATENSATAIKSIVPSTEIDCLDLATPQQKSRCFLACQDHICCFQGGSKNCAGDASKQCSSHNMCQPVARYTRSEIILPPFHLMEVCNRSRGNFEDDGFISDDCRMGCSLASCCHDNESNVDCSAEFCLRFKEPCQQHWNYNTHSTTASIHSIAPYALSDCIDIKSSSSPTPELKSRCFLACENHLCCFQGGSLNCAGDSTKQCSSYSLCQPMAQYTRSDIVLPSPFLGEMCKASSTNSVKGSFIKDNCRLGCSPADCCYDESKHNTGDCTAEFCERFQPCEEYWNSIISPVTTSNTDSSMAFTTYSTDTLQNQQLEKVKIDNNEIVIYAPPKEEIDCAETEGMDYLYTPEQQISRCYTACQDYICCFQGGDLNCASDISKKCANHGACQHLANMRRSDVVLPPDNLDILCSDNDGTRSSSSNHHDNVCGLVCRPASCCLDPPEAWNDPFCSREFCSTFRPCKHHWSTHDITDANIAAILGSGSE